MYKKSSFYYIYNFRIYSSNILLSLWWNLFLLVGDKKFSQFFANFLEILHWFHFRYDKEKETIYIYKLYL